MTAGQYTIKSNNECFTVRAAGKLRYQNESPVVGDFVEFTPKEFLTAILPRKNSLIRPKVANVDQALIVMSLKEPNYSSILLNKFLAIIEHNGIKPIIIFTKKDLTTASYLEEYENMGYQAFEVSNSTNEGIENLKPIFKNKLSVFTGQTGAGKSSTINSIAGLNLKTDKISKALGRGKHTTRVVSIIEWMDGQLIDTPGFSSLTFAMNKLELSRSYKIFEEASTKCKFPRTCIHYKEISCGVKIYVKKEKISNQMYKDYIRLLQLID
ncbi:MAG: ribosome small subunit-dependent GTPase A [Mycoplasmataceae bacterium]|nr:ribosome small subunit-dependent GTPase A [Mycoplasmataceae bacterium]